MPPHARRAARSTATLAASPRRSSPSLSLGSLLKESLHTELTRDELNLIAETDSDLLAPRSAKPEVSRCVAIYSEIIRDALSVTDAARILDVDQSRIRQRLTQEPPDLYGLKVAGEWKIPKFQFDDAATALVPGVECIVSSLRKDVHPVAFFLWFTLASPDLFFLDEPISPREWLRAGNSPDQVVRLVKSL